MHAIRGLGLAAGCCLLALLAAAIPATAPVARADGATRILLYGDSITQGSSGDWTWRYRLWQHLVGTAGAVDMVGPRDDLHGYVSGLNGSQAYADPAFDTDHAALWGMQLGNPTYDISTLVSQESPDVVVGLIGLNDLLFGLESPEQLIGLWRTEITQAREVSPGVAFVLVQVPETWYAGVPAYDADLVDLAEELDTPESRVLATGLAAFDSATDTYDHTHPSASGEVKIAAVVADSLAQLGVGTPFPRPLPTLPPGPVFAPVPVVTASEERLRVAWPAVDYAGAERVWVRDVTADAAWWSSSGRVTADSWSRSATGGHTYAVELQPVKGTLASSYRSVTRRVRVPARPAAPRGVTATPLSGARVRIGWRAVRFATGYHVLLRDRTAAGPWRTRPATLVRRTGFVDGSLRRGHHYVVRVRSYGPLAGAASSLVTFTARR